MTKLGDLIKAKRNSEGLSLRDFSERCNLSHSYIKNLEDTDPRSGREVVPTIDSMDKIALALGMTLEQLLRETGYIGSAGGNFEPANLKVIRNNRTYDTVCEDMALKVGEKIEPAVYEAVEKGIDKNPSPLLIDVLAKYADVDKSFFYKRNPEGILDYARAFTPYKDSGRVRDSLHHISDTDLRKFVSNPDNIEYLKLAKEFYDRKLKVKFIRDALFED